MKSEEIFFKPTKLQKISKQLQLRLDRRKKARELLLPNKNNSFINKVKSVFSS